MRAITVAGSPAAFPTMRRKGSSGGMLVRGTCVDGRAGRLRRRRARAIAAGPRRSTRPLRARKSPAAARPTMDAPRPRGASFRQGNRMDTVLSSGPEPGRAREHGQARAVLHEMHDGSWPRGPTRPDEPADGGALSRLDGSVLSPTLPRRAPAAAQAIATK